MKRFFSVLTGLMLILGNLGAQDMAKDFQDPPKDARIRVWWHWMDGNISKDGIRKDIEWFKRAGIGGFQQFDAGGTMMGGGQAIVEKLPYMSDTWKDAFRYAIRLADSLDMEVAIASAPGWSSTGGPWVKPENAMKRLTWRTVEVKGDPKAKTPQKITFPEPFGNVGKFQNAGEASLTSSPADIDYWYDDVAVIAMRIPDDDVSMAQMGAEVSSSGGDFTVAQLTDGDLANGSSLKTNPSGTHSWIQYSFPEKTIIRALTLVGGQVRGQWASESPSYSNYLQASDNGIDWTTVCRIPSGSVAQQTIDIPITAAKYFRLMVANPVPDMTYAAYGYAMPAPEGTMIHEFKLYSVTKVNHAEEKAGFAAPHDLADNPTPECFDPVMETIDLTNSFHNGVLTWQVPEGNWRIYRFGASLTGKQNHPAPPEATGLEVDKLDKEAWLDYFHNYMDMYKEAAGGMVGQRGIQYILTDSYEAEQMTWTKSMAEEFKNRRGYDLMPWMPALTGEIISSSTETEKFLFDWRKTIGELFVENYDRINDIAKEYGMKGRYTESHENGRVFVGDGMDLKMTAAVPMSAIWMPNGGGGSTIPMARADIKESSSTAHVYGQNIAAAESFTAAGLLNNAWSYYPGNIKYTADLAMSEGLNRFVIHESAHQPSDAHKPGLGLMIFGQWFNRHDTWAEYARYWSDYLARSCYMLQQGKYVADILWYYGEDTNIAGIYGLELPEIPDGYAYDFINPNGILNEVNVRNGKIVTRSGMEYSVLVLGEHCKTMSVKVLRKIAELASQGAIICGQIPESPAELYDNPSEFDRLVADIWRSGRPNVFTGHLSGVLKANGIEPDFTYVAPAEIKYVHRASAGKDIYWIRNFSDNPVTAQVKMRDAVGYIEVWDPETGKEIYGVLDGNTLKLEPNQALFVVADEFFNGEAEEYVAPRIGRSIAMDAAWKATFEGMQAPKGTVTFPVLRSYTESDDPDLKYFSGTATYTNTFTLAKKEAASMKGLALNLGEVGAMADVFINGEHAGFLWKAPYKVNFEGMLRPGKNTVEIKVINLWPNRLIGDAQPGAEGTTFTTMPFYRADSPLTPAGLMGPVEVKALLK
ncbi:MAG: discoidin domain-containing protein [Bacteroidales bacterium]|nr:discoidin domain-containing protein [Bacteroidales bacterium]